MSTAGLGYDQGRPIRTRRLRAVLRKLSGGRSRQLAFLRETDVVSQTIDGLARGATAAPDDGANAFEDASALDAAEAISIDRRASAWRPG